MPATATLQFLPGWREQQQGVINRGGILTVQYDKSRLSPCFAPWRGAELGDIVAYCRFQPRGDIVTGSVVAPVRDRGTPDGTVIDHVAQTLDVSVPLDATHVELWFQNFSQTSTRCDAWDSRYGQNYWFSIGGAPPRFPSPAVAYRVEALTRPEIVNVLSQQATKVDAIVSKRSGGTEGANLQTTLDVVAWVQDSKYGANAWIDLHVFDDGDQLIEARTIPLPYTGFGPYPRFGFSGLVYQGSVATPGSVSPRPDARTLQYRLYFTLDYQLFTDGVLHQLDLPADAIVSR
jgi:Family of unknown function (DUF6209)